MGSSADEDVPITRELIRSVAPTGFAVIAFALAFIGCVQCNVIKFTSTSIDGFESDKPLTIQFGFWTHEDLQIYEYSDTGTNGTYAVLSCTTYDELITMESMWKAAAVFSFLPLILGGILFIFMCCKTYKIGSASVHWADSVVYLLAFLFQGLSIMFLNTTACKDNPVITDISDKFNGLTFQDTCSISTGMRCIISSTVFWALAAFASADAYKRKLNKEKNGSIPITQPLIGDSVLY